MVADGQCLGRVKALSLGQQRFKALRLWATGHWLKIPVPQTMAYKYIRAPSELLMSSVLQRIVVDPKGDAVFPDYFRGISTTYLPRPIGALPLRSIRLLDPSNFESDRASHDRLRSTVPGSPSPGRCGSPSPPRMSQDSNRLPHGREPGDTPL